MFFAVAVLLFCNGELSHAATIDVGSAGTYSTIQNGYNACMNGNTIEVQEGTYGENDNFNKNIPIALKGGYDSGFSTNSSYSVINGTLIISNGTVTAGNIIIQLTAGSSPPPAPPEPWPSIPPGSISYITGTTCPVDSTLECSQQIPNGSSCFYQSCECFFSAYNVGDTDSGYWQTYDASGNRTGIFDCEHDGGLTALQIREGSCSLESNSQAQAFINSCGATTPPQTTSDISGTWSGTYTFLATGAFGPYVCANIENGFIESGALTMVISTEASSLPFTYNVTGTVSMSGLQVPSVPCGGGTLGCSCPLEPFEMSSAPISSLSMWSGAGTPANQLLIFVNENVPPSVPPLYIDYDPVSSFNFSGTYANGTITGSLGTAGGTFKVTKE